jgi:hypothetical protein
VWTELETEQELRTGSTGRGNYLPQGFNEETTEIRFRILVLGTYKRKIRNIFFQFSENKVLKSCCRISGVFMLFLLSTCLGSARSVTEIHTEHVRGASCDIYFFPPFISTFCLYFPHENVATDVLLGEILCSADHHSICVPERTEEVFLLVCGKKCDSKQR